MKFNDRLRELRKEHNLLQKDIAEKIGVSRDSITKYESGDREPTLDNIIKMAEIFDVSIDYLIGVSDIKVKTEPEYLVFIEKIKETEYRVSDLIKLFDMIKNLPKPKQ